MVEDSGEHRKYMLSTLSRLILHRELLHPKRQTTWSQIWQKLPDAKNTTRHINLQRNVAKRDTTVSMTGTCATSFSGAP